MTDLEAERIRNAAAPFADRGRGYVPSAEDLPIASAPPVVRAPLGWRRMPFTPVCDQGPASTCASYAFKSAWHSRALAQGSVCEELSALWLHWWASTSKSLDLGVAFPNLCTAVNERGVCADRWWPYDLETWGEPPDVAAQHAWDQRGMQPHAVPDSATAIALLDEDIPVWVGFRTLFGGPHALFVRGYQRAGTTPPPPDDPREPAWLDAPSEDHFLVQNSWGDGYADRGFIWIPRRFFDDVGGEQIGMYCLPWSKTESELAK